MGIVKLSELAAKRPWVTLLLWVLLLVGSGLAIGKYLESALTTEQGISIETEGRRAANLVKERLGTTDPITELVIIKSPEYKVSDTDFAAFTIDLQKQLQDLGSEVVSATISFYQTQNPGLVSASQDAALVIVNLSGSLVEAEENVEKIRALVEKFDENENFAVYQSGLASVNKDFQEIAEKDLQQAELFGIPIALVVLIFVFGAVTAAFVPVILSFIAIALALGASAIFGQVSQLSFFVTNMITMMGLAVGIDYSLFVVSRFREERALGMEKLVAISNSAKTASRAVFFSGITVVVALAGLLFIPSNVFRSLSIGAIFVVIAAVLAALTLLPALLSILGDKINFLTIPWVGRSTQQAPGEKGFWHTVASWVMKMPVLSLEIAAGVLILAAIPLLSLNIGSSGAGSLPESARSKEGFEILQNEFSGGLLSPTKVVINGPVSEKRVSDLINYFEEDLRSIAAVSLVTKQAHPDKNLVVFDVIIKSETEEAETIRQIRDLGIIDHFADLDTEVLVGGEAALNYDFTQVINDYTPTVFVFVLGLSFLFLMLVFRSIVVPLKALIMNLLSVGAAYGLLVLVFQKGIGASLFGFAQTDQIEAWIPIFLFAILFGLSMDYHVFLLSRVREKFSQSGDNTEAVVFGLSQTGRLITGAALIMMVVFAGFAAGELVMFQQVGFGLAVAILLDATIVRSILVPASMKLLGSANWYLPRWLSWLPKIGIEG